MISLGLEMGVNFFDSCTPREEHVRENFSASWTGLTTEARTRLQKVAASGKVGRYGWLEQGWVSGQ